VLARKYLPEDAQQESESEDSENAMKFDKNIRVKQRDLNGVFKMSRIVQSSSKMMQLLNQGILNSTLVKQGKLIPQWSQVFCLKEALAPLFDIFKSQIKKKSLDFQVKKKLSGDQGIIKIIERKGLLLDVDLYQQIVYHIFANAIKFTTNGGKIAINMSVIRCVNLVSSPSNDCKVTLLTEIEDNGVGMTKT